MICGLWTTTRCYAPSSRWFPIWCVPRCWTVTLHAIYSLCPIFLHFCRYVPIVRYLGLTFTILRWLVFVRIRWDVVMVTLVPLFVWFTVRVVAPRLPGPGAFFTVANLHRRSRRSTVLRVTLPRLLLQHRAGSERFGWVCLRHTRAPLVSWFCRDIRTTFRTACCCKHDTPVYRRTRYSVYVIRFFSHLNCLRRRTHRYMRYHWTVCAMLFSACGGDCAVRYARAFSATVVVPAVCLRGGSVHAAWHLEHAPYVRVRLLSRAARRFACCGSAVPIPVRVLRQRVTTAFPLFCSRYYSRAGCSVDALVRSLAAQPANAWFAVAWLASGKTHYDFVRFTTITFWRARVRGAILVRVVRVCCAVHSVSAVAVVSCAIPRAAPGSLDSLRGVLWCISRVVLLVFWGYKT